jgi:diaminopimelate epimerase
MYSEIRFTKLSGSGNDFVFIDNREGSIPGHKGSALARSLCQHHLSVGADGIVLIGPPPAGAEDMAYSWRYINADGSDGEMCGNAAMCSARFALRHGIAPAHHQFLTASGPIEAWADADSQLVSIAMPDTGPVGDPIELAIGELTVKGWPVQVGVPHVVIPVEDADAFADSTGFHTFGKAVRHHDAFPTGTNVNIVSPRTGGSWRMRTYERGVERETLACGTGVVATSVVLAQRGLADPPVTVAVSSGKRLQAELTLDDQRGTGVRLRGSATFVFDGILNHEAMQDLD